jgi:hypothetical protein
MPTPTFTIGIALKGDGALDLIEVAVVGTVK